MRTPRSPQRASSLFLSATLLAAAPLGLAGCATQTGAGGGGGILGGIEDAAASLVLPVEQEIALGRQLQQEFESQVRLHQNREVQAYVDRVGRAVARRADLPRGITPQFHVVDDDKTVNAVALPGGAIYVYSGLLKLMDDESELAGVLAHEVAHVAERHVAERLAKAYGLELVAGLALGQNPGLVKQIAASLAAQGSMLAFSRADEREADFSGLSYLDAAGYDPRGMIRVFEELGRKSGRGGGFEFLQSHPSPGNRVEYLAGAIARDDRRGGRTARAEFQDFKREL